MLPRSPADIVMEMGLELAKSPGLAFLVVEGYDDAKYWKPRLRADSWRCIVANGKANVTGSMAYPSRKQLALGIVDADYDYLDGVACPHSVCRTDGHDLEALLIRSGALQRLLHEMGSSDKIAAFERTSGAVLDRLLSMGTELAALRRANHVHRWGLKFKKDGGKDRISYAKFVEKKNWKLSRELMVATVLNYNSRHDLSATTVLAEMSLLVPPPDLWHWLNGHDLAAILAIGLSHVLGSENRGLAEVESSLRLAHDSAELEATALGQSIRSWETSAARPLLAF